jgi:membrane protease YdiL (CAAX protease family)
LEGLRELIINRDYRRVDHLTPLHGVWLFIGWGLLYVFLSLFLGPMLSEKLAEGNIGIQIVAIQLPLFVFCTLFIIGVRMRFADLKLRPLRPVEWAAAVIMAVAALVGAVVVLIPVIVSQMLLSPELFTQSLEEAKVFQEAIIPGSGVELAFYLVLLAVIPAVVEELFFRGLIMDAFMRFGPFWAIVISSVAFGVSHQMPLRIPSLTLVGFFLAAFKYRTGKLTASIIMHIVYNSVLITIAYLFKGAIESNMLSFIRI